MEQRTAAQHDTHPAAQRGSAPQNTKGNSTALSNAPQPQTLETAQSKGTARGKRTSKVQHSTAQSGEDRERTAGRPRTYKAQGTAANNSKHQHTRAKNTQHRAHSAEKHDKTQCFKAQDPRVTGSAQGHDGASSGTKQSETKQHSAQQHTARRNTAPQRGVPQHPGTQHSTQ